MSNPINSSQAARSGESTQSRKEEAPKEPENIRKAAGEFASLMEGKPKNKQNAKGLSQSGEAASAGSATGESALPGESPWQSGLQRFDGQQRFADGRTAAMARDATDLPADAADSLTSEKNSQPTFGDSILQAFGGQPRAGTQTPQTDAAHVSNATATSPGETIAEVSQTIADRILVSDPAHGGDAEVRIVMKDSVLPGTEVRITEQNGELQIQFHTDSSESRDMLSKHQAQMTERLNERLDRNVAVDIEFDSKGQGDQQGRSRQQRDLAEEMREQE